MANILIFKQGQEPQYLESVDTGEYVVNVNVPKDKVESKDPDILINPDISSLKEVPIKYWKKQGKSVIAMSKAERLVVDQLEEDKVQESKDNFENVETSNIARLLVERGVLTKEDIYGNN